MSDLVPVIKEISEVRPQAEVVSPDPTPSIRPANPGTIELRPVIQQAEEE